MIPKIIHYCWFGQNPLPELAIKCINSWKKYFPDYEIKEWNEYELKAVCWGEKIDPSRHSVWLEIKAITYHLLKIEYHPEGSEDCRWYGRVLFDV